jgi:vacuolar-type H+-ATPase catalytic subunit A/Vma1
MELWIRSQDKSSLEKIDNGIIVVNYIIRKVFADQNMFVDLANYKTKERALEVLDEIQNYIIGIHDNAIKNLYEMPEE